MTAQLVPPWDTDQAAINAAEILGHVRRRDGRYQELRELTRTCSHADGRSTQLVRYFSGPDDAGDQRTWVLVAAHRTKGRDTPPLCTPVPRPGELAFTLTARCSRCRAGWVVFPGGLPLAVNEVRDAGGTLRLIQRSGRSMREPFEVGDDTDYFEGDEWFDGPLSVVSLRVEAPTLGHVVDG